MGGCPFTPQKGSFHASSRIMMNKYVNVFQSYFVSDDLLITSDTEVMLRQKVCVPRRKECI